MPAIEQGDRVRVRFRAKGTKPVEEMVVTFLTVEGQVWWFSGDPEFGTSKLDGRRYEIQVDKVESTTPIKRPARVKQ